MCEIRLWFLFSLVYLFTRSSNLIINLLLFFSIYLILQSIFDFYENSKNGNVELSRGLSHLGFGFLIFFISINHLFSIEGNFNFKVGEKKILKEYVIEFKNLKTLKTKNYDSVLGSFEILNKRKMIIENLKPEIRLYNQPETMTYEASINSNFFSDTYLTMSNISGTDIFNVKFQKKPFMSFIWFSVILISLGGMLKFFIKRKKTWKKFIF